ncbi:MAG: hypothetical protein OEW58_11115 [Gammaproteobacteria bacterium]|nr:hypothetical protein [Gammaproteobacteria bacterium]
MSRLPFRLLFWLFLFTLVLSACDKSPDSDPKENNVSLIPACGGTIDTPLFAALPVAESAISEVIVFGELDPGGGDVIPNGQTGIRLAQQGVQLVAPADAYIVAVKKATWLASPTRQGESDYTVVFRPCTDVTVTFSHVATITPNLESYLGNATCEEYSTESETIRSCVAEGFEIPILAGDVLGTAGGVTAGGLDFDMMDLRSTATVTTRVEEPYYKNAVCFSRYYSGANRTLLESKTGLSGDMRDGTPACGTIEVDIAETAQGVWVRKDNPVAYSGNADSYLTLAPGFLHPEAKLDLSFGGQALRPLMTVPRSTVGRTNLDFGSVSGDGLIYCYADVNDTVSVFLSLSANQELKIERLTHDLGLTPCSNSSDTWAFSNLAVTYIR